MVKSSNIITNIEYCYEKVFKNSASQSDVYSDLSDLLYGAYEGMNVCIFTYGNTGSGKTYTIFGGDRPGEQGLLPRTVSNIKERLLETHNRIEYDIKYGFSELYNDKLYNLLKEGREEIDGFVMERLVDPKRNVSKLMSLVNIAKKKRTIGKTDMNETSSRSHSFFQFEITSKEDVGHEIIEKVGTITFIDLAGSEKVGETAGVVGREKKSEVLFINKSLSSLRDVLIALSTKESYIPFRNSKLTSLLQKYLGHDAKTFIIVNVCSSYKYYHQTKSSLEFAKSIPKIENKHGIKRHVITTPKMDIEEQDISNALERALSKIIHPV